MLQENQKIYAIFISICIAALSIFFIDYTGQANLIFEYYFGKMDDAGDFDPMLKDHFFTGIQKIAVLFFITIIIHLFFALVLFVCVSILYVIFTSKWQKPNVFISYKHAEADAKVNTDKIALDMKIALEKQGFSINFFKYDPNATHDQVNYQIRALLRNSDMMIVVPDPYKPSYVNTEIQCAAYDNKPVFIVKHTKDQRLPDTANSGHPVILYDKLDKNTFFPIPKMLLQICNHWSVRWRLVLFALFSPFQILMLSDDEDGISLTHIAIFVGVSLLLVKLCVPFLYIIWAIKFIVFAIVAYGAYFAIVEIFKSINLKNAARQSVLTGGDTNAIFASVFENDKKILDCLDKF